MKTYSITPPSIEGMLSDDFLYFEGVTRPSIISVIRDANYTEIKEMDSGKNIEVLEKYFNDIYNLFLRKLSSFAMFEHASDEDAIKMQALLQELIKVKSLIEGAMIDQKNHTSDNPNSKISNLL